MTEKEYDVIIIGGGPAGLSAGLYTSRSRLDTLLIERGVVGGRITDAELVENYPGFAEGISGAELGQLMQRQAAKYGLNITIAEVTGLKLKGDKKVVSTSRGDFIAKAVILASGSERGKLGVPGEIEVTGKGVSYCATCDGPLFRGKTVAVVGGGNAAISEALYLAKFASKVIVIHRRDQLRATRVLEEKARAEAKIEFLWDTVVEEIEGEKALERLKLRQVKTGQKSSLDVAGVFIAVGLKPSTDFLKGVLTMDAGGYIVTNERMETEIPGIFAAGDIRQSSPRQAITAAGDGATAAVNAEIFLSR
jgi:thioredoxin reductase (NADPH)